MAYEFTKLSDLPVEQEFPEGGKVIINDNGTIKQCEANGLGGGAGGMVIDFQGVGYFVTQDELLGDGGGACLASIDPDAPEFMEGFYVVPDSYMEQLKNTYFSGGNVVVISRDIWTNDNQPESGSIMSDGVMPLDATYLKEEIEVYPCEGHVSNIILGDIVSDQLHCVFTIPGGEPIKVIPFEGANYSIYVMVFAIIDESTLEEVQRYAESYEPPKGDQ